jgi:hypothetical protein
LNLVKFSTKNVESSQIFNQKGLIQFKPQAKNTNFNIFQTKKNYSSNSDNLASTTATFIRDPEGIQRELMIYGPLVFSGLQIYEDFLVSINLSQKLHFSTQFLALQRRSLRGHRRQIHWTACNSSNWLGRGAGRNSVLACK